MQHSNPVANALQPFLWGSGGQKMSPEEVARKRQLAAALASNNSAPQNIGQGLNRIGEALLYNSLQSRTADAEKAGRASTADAFNALMQSGQPETAAIINQLDQPWGSDAQRAVLGQMLERNLAPPPPAPERNILKGADGFNYYTDTGERVLPNVQAQTGVSVLTPEERSAIGISPDDTSIYQRKPDGSIVKIGGSGVNVTVNNPSASQGEFFDKIASNEAENFATRRVAAQDAIKSLNATVEAEKLLDGGMITGLGANFILGMGKGLQQIGVNYSPDAVSNTEAFVASRAQEVGRIIKLFGAGTGLSDADRDYAEKAAAGQIELTEQSIRKILDINRRGAINVINSYNETATQIPEGIVPYNLQIPLPDFAQQSPQPQQGLGIGQTVDLGDGVTITRNN